MKLSNGETIAEIKSKSNMMSTKYSSYIKVADMIGYADYKEYQLSAEKLVSELKSKYPLLEYIQYYTPEDAVKEYITLIDGVKS